LLIRNHRKAGERETGYQCGLSPNLSVKLLESPRAGASRMIRFVTHADNKYYEVTINKDALV
jgi:hypothetical protein